MIKDDNISGQSKASITYFQQPPQSTSGAEGSAAMCTELYRLMQTRCTFYKICYWSVCKTWEVCACLSATLQEAICVGLIISALLLRRSTVNLLLPSSNLRWADLIEKYININLTPSLLSASGHFRLASLYMQCMVCSQQQPSETQSVSQSYHPLWMNRIFSSEERSLDMHKWNTSVYYMG